MSYLKERIMKDGQVFPGNVLKIDSFLNHQIDPHVMHEIELELFNYFKTRPITKVLTVEASGIAPAIMVAARFDVPMLFAKKQEASTTARDDRYSAEVYSYTKQKSYNVFVSQQYLTSDDHVLIIDDFLANGQAALGLAEIVRQAGAVVEGVGICVEKSFQPGRQLLEEAGIDVYSVARIASLDNNTVRFKEGN